MIVCLLCGLLIALLIILWYQDRPHYYANHPLLEHIKKLVRPLAPRKVDELQFRESGTTYTLDKSILYFCVRNPQGEYYDLNTLIYVAIHELAHAVIPYDTSDHGKDWQKVFETMLVEGQKLGIYDPQKSIAPVYCGVNNHTSQSTAPPTVQPH